MRELLFEQRPCFNAIAAEFGLAPAGVMALRYLRPGESMPMRLLAESLHFDSSNVTGIVDRLEERGLVERRASDQDRRVKLLVITEAGTELRDRLIARMDEPPPPLADLSPEDQWALRDLLARALER
jgi:DNA-binding MarR family transcriptional regulator